MGHRQGAGVSFDAVRLKELMQSRGLTLSVAESLTSGRIQAAVGAASGASNYFLGGVTVYTIDQKVSHLHVDRQHAEAVNAVSARVAEEMARGVAQLFGSDYSVSTTGYAEPSPNDGVPDPFAHVAVWQRSGEEGLVIFSGVFSGPGLSRIEMQERVAEFVLGRLQDHLEEDTRSTVRC
jgi:nicotinamide-nucleotide amidase